MACKIEISFSMKAKSYINNLFIIIFIFFNFGYCQTKTNKMKTLVIKSSSFEQMGMIPGKYTCKGINVSPPLQWSDVPEGTKSFSLINDDPDAPAGTFVHWLLYNIPADVRELKENIPSNKELDNGSRHGLNDFGRSSYGGPCPPSGIHRYFFKLYALDKILDLPAGATKNELLKAMQGHILAEGELIGRCKK